MRVSDAGLVALARHEGIVLGPYLDSVGVPTIGIGHTASAGSPDPRGHRDITAAEALEIFRRDIAKFEARVLRAVKVPLLQHEFDALVSFDFNTGGITRARLVEHLNAGDRARAAEGLMGWLKPPEITERRAAERRLFEAADYGAGPVPLYRAVDGRAVRSGSIASAQLLTDMRKAAAPRPVPRPAAAPSPEKRLSAEKSAWPQAHPLNPESPWAALWRSIIALLGR